MPDIPSPILPKILITLSMDPLSGAMDMSLPNDTGLALRMLAVAMERTTLKQMQARSAAREKPKVETAGAGLLHALPPVNGKS